MKQVLLILSSLLLVSCSGIRARYHTVSSGDTLWNIAKRYSVPMGELKEHNPVPARKLRPGQKLFIPFEANPRWDNPEIVIAEDRSPASPVAYDFETAHFNWPVKGRLSSNYGYRRLSGKRRFHEGIDIAVPRGTPVHASRSGHVIYASSKIGGYGNMVIVRHADKFSSVYAHLSKFHVRKGQFISRGQVLGRAGATGRATGVHVHFEIRNGQKAVNPINLLDRNRRIATR